VYPTTGVVFGMVVAHDSDTLMTYIIPTRSLFESIFAQCGLGEVCSIGRVFSTSESPTGSSSPSPGIVNRKEHSLENDFLPSLDSSATDSGILQEFRSTLNACMKVNFEGHVYIEIEALLHWLRSDSSTGTCHVDLLLDRAYSEAPLVPVSTNRIAEGETACLRVFSILLELGHGNLIARFQRLGLVDNSMPFDSTRLQEALARVGLPNPETLADEFFRRQWAYAPMVFGFDMHRDLHPRTIIPISRRERINAKGGTATLWQIDVPEEFVDAKLRKVTWNSRYRFPGTDRYVSAWYWHLRRVSR
jgi:hypothetical protein